MSDVSSDGERIPLRSLRWGRMSKLCFDKRKLSITGMDGACISLYAQSEQKARYLLEFCRALHQAIIAINNHYFLNPYAYGEFVQLFFIFNFHQSFFFLAFFFCR